MVFGAVFGRVYGDVFGSVAIDQPVLTTIVVSPATATVAAGGTQQFTATQLDQYGDPINDGPVEWSVDGSGSIDQSGLYTASETAASDVVTAMLNGVTGTATVTVSVPGTGDLSDETIAKIAAAVLAAQAVGTGDCELLISAVHGIDGVPGVDVRIVGSVARAITGTMGQARLRVDGGTADTSVAYTLRVTPPAAYAAVPDLVVNVFDGDVSVPIVLSHDEAADDIPPEWCELTLRVIDQHGLPLRAAQVAAFLISDGPSPVVRHNTLSLTAERFMPVGANGKRTLLLLRDQKHRLVVRIPGDRDHELLIRTPNASQVILEQSVQTA